MSTTIRATFALLLGLLGACSPSGRQHIGSGSCAAETTCGDCVAFIECGWCGSPAHCTEGTASGASNSTCPGATWSYTPNQCPDPSDGSTGPSSLCPMITTCGPCADQSACGFCTANNQCEPLAYMATCGASHWVTDFSVCP